MKRLGRRSGSSSLGMAIALLLAATAAGQELDVFTGQEEIDACAQTCRGDSGFADCRFDADESKRLCVEQRGCEQTRSTYGAACFGENRDASACDDARTKFRDCVTPCTEGFHARMGVCMNLLTTCLEKQCGVDLPEPGGPGVVHRFEL